MPASADIRDDWFFDMNAEELLDAVLRCGVDKAALISTEDIVTSSSFREICRKNTCGGYASNYMCPPAVGDIDALIEKVYSYRYGVLYQNVFKIEDSFDFEGMTDAKNKHMKMSRAIEEGICSSIGGHVHLSSGMCDLCSRCAGKDNQPCRFPRLALPSMSAYGIDVSGTCRGTDLKYINGAGTVTYFGLILAGSK